MEQRYQGNSCNVDVFNQVEEKSLGAGLMGFAQVMLVVVVMMMMMMMMSDGDDADVEGGGVTSAATT